MTGESLHSNLSISCKEIAFVFKGLTGYIIITFSCGNDSLWTDADGRNPISFACIGLLLTYFCKVFHLRGRIPEVREVYKKFVEIDHVKFKK